MISKMVFHETVAYIKEVNPTATKVHYFLDGCAAQYKNCKHFLNLCQHKNDFSADSVWNFFATSHSKSPCNGVGGAVKRPTAQAGLQRPVTDQILSAKDMKFCEESINGIKFAYTSSEAAASVESALVSTFTLVKTFPETRDYNQFAVKMKRISYDDAFELELDFLGKKPQLSNSEPKNMRVSQYLLCKYDSVHWIGRAPNIDPSAYNIKVKLMHPNYPSRSYR